MIVIDCPHCGEREETEFNYGGQAHVNYPADPAALSDAEWAHYLFYRDNPAGDFAERWVHAAGCRKWFNVVRDTRTYVIRAVYLPDQPRPDLSAGHLAAGVAANDGVADNDTPLPTGSPASETTEGDRR